MSRGRAAVTIGACCVMLSLSACAKEQPRDPGERFSSNAGITPSGGSTASDGPSSPPGSSAPSTTGPLPVATGGDMPASALLPADACLAADPARVDRVIPAAPTLSQFPATAIAPAEVKTSQDGTWLSECIYADRKHSYSATVAFRFWTNPDAQATGDICTTPLAEKSWTREPFDVDHGAGCVLTIIPSTVQAATTRGPWEVDVIVTTLAGGPPVDAAAVAALAEQVTSRWQVGPLG